MGGAKPLGSFDTSGQLPERVPPDLPPQAGPGAHADKPRHTPRLLAAPSPHWPSRLVTVCSGALSQEGSLLDSPLQGFRMLSVVHLNEIVGIGTVNLNSLCAFSLVLGAHCFRLFLCLCKYNLKVLIIRI